MDRMSPSDNSSLRRARQTHLLDVVAVAARRRRAAVDDGLIGRRLRRPPASHLARSPGARLSCPGVARPRPARISHPHPAVLAARTRGLVAAELAQTNLPAGRALALNTGPGSSAVPRPGGKVRQSLRPWRRRRAWSSWRRAHTPCVLCGNCAWLLGPELLSAVIAGSSDCSSARFSTTTTTRDTTIGADGPATLYNNVAGALLRDASPDDGCLPA